LLGISHAAERAVAFAAFTDDFQFIHARPP
jgi:hypothetical protein